MVALVELDEVKARLQFDLDDHDEDLDALIEAASEAVLTYLKLDVDHYDNTDGNPEDVPAVVKTAVIMLVGILKRDPTGMQMEKWQPGYLPAPVTALLYGLRDPTMA